MQGMDDTAMVRHQDFECDAPVEVIVELGAGRLDVRLVEARRAPGRWPYRCGRTRPPGRLGTPG